MHFYLLQNAFLLTEECISPYCIWSLKDPAHHIPNQAEIATEEFCPKSLLRKQNEINFIESHFQSKIKKLPLSYDITITSRSLRLNAKLLAATIASFSGYYDVIMESGER